MPLVTIKLFEDRLTADPDLARRIAVAVDEVIAAECTTPGGDRPETWVTVEGVPRSQWTFNGRLR